MHEHWNLLPLVTVLASCTSGGAVMQPRYAREAVQPIKVELSGSERLTLGYRIPMETLYYSQGVDYKVEGGVLRVYISRCNINTNCKVMAPNQRPPTGSWDTQVILPYHGERVVIVHDDGEQQVYP